MTSRVVRSVPTPMMTQEHLVRLVVPQAESDEISHVSLAPLSSKLEKKTERTLRVETKIETKSEVPLGVRLLGKGAGGLFTRGNFKLAIYYAPTVNTSAGKYLQFLATTGTVVAFSGFASAAEFTSLDVLFDEVFVHSMTMIYKPRNKYSAISTAAAAADTNTVAANIYFMPSGAAQYTDNSNAFVNSAVTTQHKIVNMGENWSVRFYNPTKFAWDGPTNVPNTTGWMGWILMSSVSGIAGYSAMATPVASGAAAGFGTLLEGGVFGDMMVYYDVSVRTRA